MTDNALRAAADCRTALVTGGTSGLGLAMAAALAEAGLRVAVTGRSAERAAEAAARLPGASGLRLDVRDEDSVAEAVAAAWSLLDGIDLLVNISVNEATMTRAGFVPYGPSRAGSEALSRVMAADLRGTPVTVNLLLPGGVTRTGMVPDDRAPALRNLLEPEVMGPPVAWLGSSAAAGVHDERIVAAEFGQWLAARQQG